MGARLRFGAFILRYRLEKPFQLPLLVVLTQMNVMTQTSFRKRMVRTNCDTVDYHIDHDTIKRSHRGASETRLQMGKSAEDWSRFSNGLPINIEIQHIDEYRFSW